MDPSYLPVNFRGTFRNISYLRKTFTAVEDDEEIHELVVVAVAQHMNLLTALFTKKINRRIWCKVRSREFWRTCRANWDNDDYLNNVRVDSITFWYLVDKLRPFLERQKTNMRPEPLEVDEIIVPYSHRSCLSPCPLIKIWRVLRR